MIYVRDNQQPYSMWAVEFIEGPPGLEAFLGMRSAWEERAPGPKVVATADKLDWLGPVGSMSIFTWVGDRYAAWMHYFPEDERPTWMVEWVTEAKRLGFLG